MDVGTGAHGIDRYGLLEDALPHPSLKPAMHRALRAEAARKVFPFRAVIQHPKNTSKNFALVFRRTASQQTLGAIRNPFHQPIQLLVREFQCHAL